MSEQINKHFKGSEWNIWDLHVHTPLSINQNYGGIQKWEEFIEALEHLPNDVKVLGINDYYFIDGYEKVMEYKLKGKLSNIDKIFPVLEFRIDTFGSGNENKLQKINLHIIFDLNENNLTNEIKKVKKEFIEQIPLTKLDKHKTKCLSIENLTNEGENNLQSGFSDLIPSTQKVFELLESPTWKDKCFLLLGYKEWSNLEKNNQLKPLKEDLYNRVSAFFTSNYESHSKSKTWLDEYGNKPLLHSCDIHGFDILDTALKNDQGQLIPSTKYHCNTWIKAEPTFEGLRQVVCEPKERVRIQIDKPLFPIKKINEVSLSFDSATQIELRSSRQKEVFCFSGFNSTISFSDYFTCFIGGRGAGKSTLLNIINKSINPSKRETSFFEGNKLLLNGAPLELSDNIKIDSTTDEVEFLEQNEIEKFATDSVEFTRAIYRRIQDDNIRGIERNIQNHKDEIDSQINRINKRKELIDSIKELQKKSSDAQKIVETNKTERYQGFTTSIKSSNADYIKAKGQRQKYIKLIEDLKSLLLEYPEYDNPDYLTTYGTAHNEIIQAIKEKVNHWKLHNFEPDDQKESELQEALAKNQQELENYLKGLGLTEENLQDVKNASVKNEEYLASKKEAEQRLANLQREIDRFNLDQYRASKLDFEKKVQEKISFLKSALDEVNKENPESIDRIDLTISFNHELANQNIFNQFIREFEKFKVDSKSRDAEIMRCLLQSDPSLILNESIDLEAMRVAVSGGNQYNMLLEKVFEDSDNFEIYKLIVSKNLLDPISNLKIDISYRGKTIEQASFGQKCTAVIVIMLLFGNNPIMIDEPEAHLDSALIAKYLVKLIKRKKESRQIIFATHNANFVINADAELIHILEMPDKQTQITSTTIENIDNRKSLLKLEGGKKAFEDRRNKWGMKETRNQ